MQVICLDLEGVLVPEIWIEFSKRTGIAELARTTRDEPDYDKLMRGRLAILDRERLGLPDIQNVIEGMGPLPGAGEFLERLRSRFQVVILSDTFSQFAQPLMRQLGWPTLFCHELEVAPDGAVRDYRLATGTQIGVKPAGGIRTAKDAIKYLVMVNEVAGPDWLTPEWFRFGASTLLNDLLMQRTKLATGRYSGPDYFTLD